MEDPVLLRIDGAVATITLNRPQVLNALDATMVDELAAAIERVESASGLRVVVLAGAGAGFMAGGDIRGFKDVMHLPPAEKRAYFERFIHRVHPVIIAMRRLPLPIVARVHGAVAGIGMSLMLASDLAIAAENAVFTLAYCHLGTTPDGGSTYFLPRLVGLKRAMELALTNRVLSAQEACEWGIVTEVVPPDSLAARTEALARTLAQGPTGAFGSAKRLLHEGWNQTLETQMELESRAIAEAGGTADGQEGIRAFVEKRKARFVGK